MFNTKSQTNACKYWADWLRMSPQIWIKLIINPSTKSRNEFSMSEPQKTITAFTISNKICYHNPKCRQSVRPQFAWPYEKRHHEWRVHRYRSGQRLWWSVLLSQSRNVENVFNGLFLVPYFLVYIFMISVLINKISDIITFANGTSIQLQTTFTFNRIF
jgi:hypothetical protein